MENEGKGDSAVCPYLQEIFDDIEARAIWNRRDDTFVEYRMGKRGKKNKPYKGAPNPVVNILDDVVSERTDQELSMMLNTPLLAKFTPVTDGVPPEIVMAAQQGFDSFLRSIDRIRLKKDVLLDTKNLRGFSVAKITRREDPLWGLVPNTEPVDPKDCIVPMDTKVPASQKAERMAFIIRLSPREVKDKEKDSGWKHTKEILNELKSQGDGDSYSNESDHDEENILKIKQKIIGINVSDYAHQTIVFYETFHYATAWDVKQSGNEKVKEGDACVSYVCPDVPKFATKVMPWTKAKEVPLTLDEIINERQKTQEETREPKTTKTIQVKKSWFGIQYRFENRSLDWYDVRGLGHKNIDNHITATKLKKKKLIFSDYSTNPMYQDDGSSVDNEQNIAPAPGKKLPKGITPAAMWVQPGQIDFDIDAEKREASQRSGAGNSLYSAAVSSSRKLEKTATQQKSEDAQRAMLSSASVDRVNDPDIEHFAMLWSELKELKVKLPMIHNGKLQGFAPMEVYDYDYMIMPATSQKHLNPELQFNRDMEAVAFAAQFKGETPMNLYETLDYVMTRHDPLLADIMLQNPKEPGVNAEPPMYVLINEVLKAVKQLGVSGQERDKEIEEIQKLAVENSEDIEKMETQNKEDKNAELAKKTE